MTTVTMDKRSLPSSRPGTYYACTRPPLADVFAALRGVSLSAGAQQQRDQAGRLLDLLLAGLRPLT